ncbi:hypothetical protein PSEUDO9AG_50622 [Pseudomonas sp. 9Ag]|nr:hypothetical protein PSEUDO9AG_50622 [Pseudomonas sp. 9Ag]
MPWCMDAAPRRSTPIAPRSVSCSAAPAAPTKCWSAAASSRRPGCAWAVPASVTISLAGWAGRHSASATDSNERNVSGWAEAHPTLGRPSCAATLYHGASPTSLLFTVKDWQSPVGDAASIETRKTRDAGRDAHVENQPLPACPRPARHAGTGRTQHRWRTAAGGDLEPAAAL